MKYSHYVFFLTILLMMSSPGLSQIWRSDLGNGMFKNPIIFADYSDPDVVKLGGDFYMTSSSFGHFPALPILHSRDLVNWQLVNHAIDTFPDPDFDIPQHGNGVWAPAIRYHNGEFMIYWGDPDRGIFVVKTRDVLGKWDAPLLVKKAKGWIDPCPLFDDDGRAYLVHAFAKSRAGINSVLHVAELSPDGLKVIGESQLVFDGHEHHPTIEGPKFYKMKGYYYIFAPAGGVKPGWQTVLRSKNVYGPYEDKIVLAQGETHINGPHQGGYLELENGESWFIHFQDRYAYGRIVHLQPVVWKDGWPVMGNDADGDGTGVPVMLHRTPAIGKTYPPMEPQTSDDFETEKLALQWQWQANYQQSWYSLVENSGHLRLYSQELPEYAANLWPSPALLLQKLPAPEFQVTTKANLQGNAAGEKAGLIIFGMDYATLVLRKVNGGMELAQETCIDARGGTAETVMETAAVNTNTVFLRVNLVEGAYAMFSYSTDGDKFLPIGKLFKAKEGRWVGAKVGLFASKPNGSPSGGYADFEFFRFD